MALPPGVSQLLFSDLPGFRFFDGEGQAGNWADPANWWGGYMPGAMGNVLVPVNASLNGSFSTHSVMLLGAELVTVNGVVTTTDANPCESFMVCDNAVAVFAPGSALHTAGALVVGNDATGTMTAEAAGSSIATLTSLDGKIGRLDDGVGTLTIAGAVWNNSTTIGVGLDGAGTLNITNGGVVTDGTDLTIGAYEGSSGRMALTNGGTLTVGDNMALGSPEGDALGSGTATVSVDATSLISVTDDLTVNANATLSLAGGALKLGAASGDLRVMTGGMLLGYGTVTSSAVGFSDLGTITAVGGTLLLDAVIHGTGVLAIGSASTLDIDASALGHVAIDFTGASGTLELSSGLDNSSKICDFAAGDRIVMAGVNQMAWNATTDVLTLKQSGHVVETLQISGAYAGDPFSLSQGSAGAVITIAPGH